MYETEQLLSRPRGELKSMREYLLQLIRVSTYPEMIENYKEKLSRVQDALRKTKQNGVTS